MNDNPFSEPDDNERTVLRLPGGAQLGAAPVAAAAGGSPAAAPPRVPLASTPPVRLAGEAETLPKVGRSPMAGAAAPLLDLLARIGARGSQVGNADELRERAMQALDAFEAECNAAGVPPDQLRAAHYALCAALDDTALATPWGQASSWSQRSLSSTYHQDLRSGERFFDMLAGLQKDPGRYLAALEVCYLCLSLGLRGRYRLDPRGTAEIERIREGLYQLLSRANGAWERELSPQWRGVDAPHLGPGRQVPAMAVAALALSLLAIGYVGLLSVVGAHGDSLQARLGDLPPVRVPVIERSVAPVPPAAVPLPADDVVERFRKFLAAEIAAGQVVVQGDSQRLMVRVMSRGMFESGSATVQRPFVDLLTRIGEGLRTEPGQVQVLGHSDNQPIRTVQFPSNFELSAARADAARRILAGAAAQAERFSAVGRADTEALALTLADEGWLIAPGTLFHATPRPGTLMRVNFATTQDARFWQRLKALR